MEIVAYRNIKDVDILVDNKCVVTNKRYQDFKNGAIKNPLRPTAFGVGYFGQGAYYSRRDGEMTAEYRAWSNMLLRCYDTGRRYKFPTYADCTVCNEWHNFQNFAAWYSQNYYEVGGERMELDKDILVKGNKVYSPDTCILVPQSINTLFTKNDLKRGKYPIGVHFRRDIGRFRAEVNVENKIKRIGYYPTADLAFEAYKIEKESRIKEIADRYKDKIPSKLYQALYAYEVEATD